MPDAWATLRAAARDRLSGAAEIAERAAIALGELPATDLPAATSILVRGHPSMAPVWLLASAALSDPEGGAEQFLAELRADVPAAASLNLPATILTISYSSSVLDAIRIRLPARVRCLRSDPGGEGERMAGAAAAWTRAEVVEDDEAIASVPADAVVVGADAVTPAGILNKVKTRALAEAAATRGVPCYAVAGWTKFLGHDLPVATPFERTPLGRFTAIGTPQGALSADRARARAEGVRLHPALLGLLDELRGGPGE